MLADQAVERLAGDTRPLCGVGDDSIRILEDSFEVPGLDSQNLRLDSPAMMRKSDLRTLAVVPKLDPECFLHRQQ